MTEQSPAAVSSPPKSKGFHSPFRRSPLKGSPFSPSKARALTMHELTSSLSLPLWQQQYQEKAAALRIQKDISPNDFSNEDLIRFLAEYNGDVRQWAAKGQAGKEWKQANLPISKEKVERSLQTKKFIYLGHDKVGRMVCYYRVKLHDPKAFKPEETMLHLVYEYENALAKAKSTPDGLITDELCMVIDRTDAKLSNTDIPLLKLMFDVLKKAYPARAELFLLCPVNWTFRKAWENLISMFLDRKTRSSTYLLKDAKALLDFIDQEELADWLGGKNAASS